MTIPTIPKEPPEFSLVVGGPLFQTYRRAHLSGPVLELVWRRVLVISLFAWMPLLVLSALEGHLYGGQALNFLPDIESHVRFLIALPVLIAAEVFVHRRLRPAVNLFLDRQIVIPQDTPGFYAAIESAMRLRNSVPVEVALLIFTYTVGQWFWRTTVRLETASWYAVPSATGLHLTLAGHWYGLISIPIFQFIGFRWYMRIAIWFSFLWRVSRLNLRLIPTHPDHAGGIGFLGTSCYAFGPILFAEGALLSGLIASRILYQGQSLLSFKVTVAALIGFFVLAIFGPLTMFTPLLARTRRSGLGRYGTLATVYVDGFDKKWVDRGVKPEEVLGTTDLQSLADLEHSHAIVREMRIVPFGLVDVTRLAIVTALPLVPLLLTIMPLEQLVTELVKIIFR